MKIRKSEILFLLIVVASFIAGYYFYPLLPDKVPSHWGADGQVNGYVPKFWGAFLMPFVTLFMLVLFMVIPRIDPKKENIAKFRIYFDGMIGLILLFLAYIYGLTLYWAIKGSFNMIRMIIPAISILFFYVGVVISRAKSNWSIGIRTPWTLSSEAVWEKTHKVGGPLFEVVALISVFGVVFTKYAIWLLLVPLLSVVLFLFVYSYVLYRKEKHA